MNTYKRLILTYAQDNKSYYFAYDESEIKNDFINMTDEDLKYEKVLQKPQEANQIIR